MSWSEPFASVCVERFVALARSLVQPVSANATLATLATRIGLRAISTIDRENRPPMHYGTVSNRQDRYVSEIK
ncbi:hypothetical protein ACPUER_33885 [Burkholderia sp. DN3021]|uniref:hypothetical protein n=1 Tax=Burkholderia sp. DN3021 TaxID=3410137 RepID=UPI003C7ED7BB